MPSLVAITGQAVDLHFKQVIIGSDPRCDIPMRADLGISFRHVVLNVTPQGTWAQAPDLNQLVIVNGNRVASAALRDGDVLTLGTVTLTFRSSLPQQQPPQQPPSPYMPPPAQVPQAAFVPPKVIGADREEPEVPDAFPARRPVVAYAPSVPGQVIQHTPLSGKKTSPGQSILAGIVGLMMAVGMIYYMFTTGGVPVKPEDLRYFDTQLVSSQQVRENRGPGYVKLKTLDGEMFRLPSDSVVDLAAMRAPVLARIGVLKDDFTSHGSAPNGDPLSAWIVTIDVNGKPRRTLAQHNLRKAGTDRLMMFVGPVIGVASLWLLLSGWEQLGQARKNRL